MTSPRQTLRRLILAVRHLVPALVLLLPVALHAQREKLPPDDLEFVMKRWPNAKKTFTGLRYVVERKGRGQPANPGDLVYVNYIGSLLDGRVFDRQLDPRKPFVFRIDRYQVITGWDEILQHMSVGEKLVVIVPSDLGYGATGQLPAIPPNATLVFEIELLRIDREQ